MSATTLTVLIARCRMLCRPRSQAADAELLRRFTHGRDAAAFEELLERYAPLVWGVCRRILSSESDCEDAFQATFLALVHRPDAVDPKQSLGGWLHTIAVRVARKAQTRARRQRPQASLPDRITAGDVADEVGSRELCRIVDEEIERLPIGVRAPLILCCLQGRTRDEAAQTLGCSVSAIKGRLERGRELLRQRLLRRGVELPIAFLALTLTSGRIRAALWAKTMQAALYTPTPAIVALAEAAIPTLTAGKCKLTALLMLLVMGTAGALGHALTAKPQATPAPLPAKPAAEPKKPQPPQVRTDRHGDPLPDGAIARLGTVRWRHGFFVHALAYSPDGKKIAAVGAGRDITLWDAASGKEIYQFPNKGTQPISLAFSPDGKILATTGRPCHLWDVATGKELRQLQGHQNAVRSIAFSPDGKRVATASADGTVRLWDVASGEEKRRIDADGEVCRLAYLPDGKEIAWSSLDGVLHFSDAATGKEQRRWKEHKKAIWNFAFSPDGKRLASSGDEGTIRLWNVATGKSSHVLSENPQESGQPLAFSPDGAWVATGHPDGTIHLWDVESGEEKRRWQAGAMPVRAIAVAPDGKTLASGVVWGGIRLWDVATGRERHPSEEPHGSIDFVRFSPDGDSLVSISRDRRMLVWDLAMQTPRRQFTWPAKGRCLTALSPDGNTLAVGSCSDFKARLWEVRLWDVRTGKPGRLLGKHRGIFGPIAFSPDGRLVASGGKDRVLHVWDASNGKEIQQIKNTPEESGSLCFSPDSKALACGTYPNGIATAEPALHLWDLSSGKERCVFAMHFSYVSSLAFSPDGKVIAAGDASRDGRFVRLWDTTTGKERCRHTDHTEDVGAVAFSPDGKLVASGAGSFGNRDNSVHVWEAATGRLLRRFEGHHSCVGSVAFSPDGLTVASAAGDSTILLWDITSRRADGRWHAKPLTPHQLETYWSALANEDAAKAYDAVWALIAAPEQAVPFLRKHLPPVPRPDAKAVARWIAELDSENFIVRQNATEELSKLGDIITAALQKALADKPSLEMRLRLQKLLDQSRDWTAERLRDHRAMQALEHIGTRQAKEVLQGLADGAAQAQRTEEAKAALQRLKR